MCVCVNVKIPMNVPCACVIIVGGGGSGGGCGGLERSSESFKDGALCNNDDIDFVLIS